MSKTTANLGFIKPEITDAADITAYNQNWDILDREINNLKTVNFDALSTDGVNYQVTIDNVTELTNGMEITIIPNMNNVSNTTALNVNNLGSKYVKLPLSTNTSEAVAANVGFFVAGCPVKLMYDANYSAGGIWKAVDKERTSVNDLDGVLPITKGGFGGTTAKQARTNLGITPSNIGAIPEKLVLNTHYGKNLPAAGTVGRIFFKTI